MILAPNSRLMLLDALRPPPGFVLDAAVGTTFTLDLDALFIPPAAWTVHAVGNRVDGVDPILLANTLRRFSDRTVVFHQAGYATPLRGKGYDELAPFVDEIVHPIPVAEHSTFHPKVWVLRFVDPDGGSGMRVLVGSRNLTFDTSWDVLVRLDSDPAAAEGIAAAPMADLVESLLARTTVPLDQRRVEMVRSVIEQLRGTTLAYPAGCSGGELRWWTHTGEYPELFPDHCDRRLVIAPFLGKPALDRLPAAPLDRSVLVSRPGSLTPAVASGFEAFTLSTEAAEIDEGAEGRIDRDLHAKVFAFDHEGRATVVIGSANATDAAFRWNDEMVVVLTGDAASLGVAQLLGEGGDEVDGPELTLRHLLQPWSPAEGDDTVGDEGDDERFYEEAIRRVASVPLIGQCSPGGGGEVEVTLRFARPVELADGVDVELTLPGNRLVPSAIFRGEAVSAFVDLSQVTRFVQARFSDPSGGHEAALVALIADMELPEGRQLRALRSLLTDSDRFMRFLRFLLGGTNVGEFTGEPGEEGSVATPRRGGTARIIEDGPVLEQLLRLLASEPSELRHLESVIREFADDDSVLPDEFRVIWAAVSPLIPKEDERAVVG